MKCFNHEAKESVGLCKACFKGLCFECAVEVFPGLACKGSCEEEVRGINEVNYRNRSAYQKTAKSYKRVALVMYLLGSVFAFVGMLANYGSEDSSFLHLIVIGLIFIFFGFGASKSAEEFKRVD